MNKIWRIAGDTGLALIATIVTLIVGYVTGEMALKSLRSSNEAEAIIFKIALPCAILACQAAIGTAVILALQKRPVGAAEIAGLILWPTLLYPHSDYLPSIVVSVLFFVLLVATFIRIRYHMRREQEKPLTSDEKMTHHIIDRERELNFDTVDTSGVGLATDPETKKRYFLNEDTEGYDPETLARGQHFKGLVTHAQYVVKVTRVFG
jgi:hypothetical protein